MLLLRAWLELPFLLTLFGLSYATFITNDTDVIAKSYEFIIVGGGTTALAVANRLSVKHTVLVVERGMDEVNNEGINNPFTPNANNSPTCHLVASSTPQVSANDSLRVLPVQYGNCLGGGSSINTMIGSRPTKAGMDAVEALGNPGWGWDDFLPFMEKSETFHPPNPSQVADGASFNASVHGFKGPVGVSFAVPLIAPETQSAAKKTTEAIYGVQLSKDLGDGFAGGHVASQYHHIHFNKTLQADRRSSSAWSFLYPQDQQRPGLTVLTSHRVNTVLTKKETHGKVTATGARVEPSAGGQVLTFHATREVIVSAGALFSPAVLQRSGIGNSSHLKSLGIEPVLDLPGVGANFQDQTLLANIAFPLADPQNTNTSGTEVLLGIVVSLMTARNAFGPHGNQILQAGLQNASPDAFLSTGGVVNAESFTKQAKVIADAYALDQPVIELFYTPGQNLSLWTQSAIPLSRGTLRINTTDPSAFPVANAEYLSLDIDMQVMIVAARKLAEAVSTPPLSHLLTANALQAAGIPAVNATDEEFRQWMLKTYGPGVHFVGSNSMMPQKLGGVVSPELLVYGTTNLRVADASIMPLSVFPHCTLGLYGVAEKAAEMILKAVDRGKK